MSIKILQERQRKALTEYERCWAWRDDAGAGFCFPCDENGNVKLDELAHEAVANLFGCVSGNFNVIDDGVKIFTHRWIEPAIGKCHCGNEVYLEHFTNTCDKCGRDYNMSGQELAPREQWGEETGEHWSECY
jgi:hypothetical protein